MTVSEEPLAIRSYRLCFELERRIHKIDRWRIPLPYGVPLRGVAYAAGALALILLAGGLPLIGQLFAAAHPAIRFVVVPVGVAYALCLLRVDGRPAHAAALAWARMALAPRRVAGMRPAAAGGRERLGDVAVSPDERSLRYRPAIIAGPATLLLRYPASGRRRGRTLYMQERGGAAMWRGKRLSVSDRQRVRVR